MSQKKFLFSILYTGIFVTLFFIVFRMYMAQEGDRKNNEQPFSDAKVTDTFKAPYIELGDVKIIVDVADTAALREQGLSGRGGLEENHGMLFLFPVQGRYAFWMKDMRFPIDIVWVAEGVVVGIDENASPESGVDLNHLKLYIPSVPVDTVIELSSGFAHAHHIALGAVMHFIRQ